LATISKIIASRAFKACVWTAAACLCAILALMAALRHERGMTLDLPTPTGPYAVGRTTQVWLGKAAADPAGVQREVFIWIWYPADAANNAQRADYLPADWRAALDQSEGTLNKLLTHRMDKVRAHSVRDAALSAMHPTYPVLLMRTGLSTLTAKYATLAEDLASHGYVVVGFDAPYRTAIVSFPDGRVMTRTRENNPEAVSDTQDWQRIVDKLLADWTGDARFVLDRLQTLNRESSMFGGRLDMNRLGVFGHSLGGATAAQLCHEDARCKAGIDIDGTLYGNVVQQGLHIPFMFLLSDHRRQSDQAKKEILADIDVVYSKLPQEAAWRLMISGATHFGFGDEILLKNQIGLQLLRWLGIVGIDGRRQLEITAYCVRHFFDRYLNEAITSEAALRASPYPELQALK
jgi:dienelactone hydrolase